MSPSEAIERDTSTARTSWTSTFPVVSAAMLGVSLVAQSDADNTNIANGNRRIAFLHRIRWTITQRTFRHHRLSREPATGAHVGPGPGSERTVCACGGRDRNSYR